MPALSEILIVEDDTILSELLKEKLQAEGFLVKTTSEGEEGLVTALKEHPHLILLDLMLPKMNGAAFLKLLRDDPWGKNVPVIVLTNVNTDAEITDNVLPHLPAYYLVKSNLSLGAIVAKIRECLNIFGE